MVPWHRVLKAIIWTCISNPYNFIRYLHKWIFRYFFHCCTPSSNNTQNQCIQQIVNYYSIKENSEPQNLRVHIVLKASIKITGCKRWCPKDLWVPAPVLTHSLNRKLTKFLFKKHKIIFLNVSIFIQLKIILATLQIVEGWPSWNLGMPRKKIEK